MQHFDILASDIPVADALAQLEAQPALWDEHPERTHESSPHFGVPDVWLRYRALQELTEPKKYLEPHLAVFYPAWHQLPAIHPIVFGLMAMTKAVYLGGILITKMPPGSEVKPHHDKGSWHAEYCNCKVHVPLKANESCINRCEDQSVVMFPGDAWTFSNLKMHSVENNGDDERINLIVCLRVEP